MLHHRRIKVVAILTNLLLIPLIAYFKYFPTIINAAISNVFIVFLVFVLLSLLVYGAFTIRRPREVYYFVPQSLILVFVARVVPILRLPYPFDEDTVYHFVSALNVITYGTLKPILSGWYSGTDLQLHWPAMHVISASLTDVAHLDAIQVMRYQGSAMGILLFLGVLVLAKIITNNNGIALLSALLVSINETTISYHSEYHPQGLAFVYFVFLLLVIFKMKPNNNVKPKNSTSYVTCLIVLMGATAISHHFSSLLVGEIAILYIAIASSVGCVPYVKDKFQNVIRVVRSDYRIWLCIAIAMLAYHFIIFTLFAEGLQEELSHPISKMLITAGPTVPLYMTLINSAKWALFATAVVSLFYVIKTKNAYEFKAGILFIICVSMLFIGTYGIFLPGQRILGFYITFAAVFGALTVFRFTDLWFQSINKRAKMLFAILIICIPMVGGFFGSNVPTFFMHDSNQDPHFYYSNNLSSVGTFGAIGDWVKKFTPPDSGYVTEMDTQVPIFYYGHQSDSNIGRDYVDQLFLHNETKDCYIVVNPDIPYPDMGNYSDIKAYLNSIDSLYNNGLVVIGWD